MEESDEVEELRCVLPFDTDSPDFARGFEAGRIWAALIAEPHESIEVVVHATNSEMALRMGEATGRDVVGERLDDCWTRLTFGAMAEHSPAPGHL